MRARRVIYARISLEEDVLIDRLKRPVGGGTKSGVIEEALRFYLPVIADSGSYVSRPLPALPSKKTDPSQKLRMYVVPTDIAHALKRLCKQHGWRQAEIIRQALAALAEKIQREPDDRSR